MTYEDFLWSLFYHAQITYICRYIIYTMITNQYDTQVTLRCKFKLENYLNNKIIKLNNSTGFDKFIDV